MTAEWFLARSALREAVRPQRLGAALLLLLLPAVIGLACRLFLPAGSFDPAALYDLLVPLLILGFTLTILSVIYGTGVVAGEVEGRTIGYLLTRPIPRWRLLLVRFAVSLLLVMVVTGLSVVLLALVLFGFGNFAEAGVLPDLRATLVGALAYGSLFLLVGALLPRPLLWGLLFVFGWETLVPRLPGKFAWISIMTYVRVLAQREVGESSGPAIPGGLSFLLNFGNAASITIAQKTAWTVLLAVSVVCLLGALLAFSRREYVPRDDAE